MIAQPNRPLDRQTFAVGILSVTAVILAVAFVLTDADTPSAYAGNMTVSGGDYILTVGTLSQGDEDLLYVVDAPSSRLAAYRFNTNDGRIELVQGIELSKYRTPTDAGGSPPPATVTKPPRTP